MKINPIQSRVDSYLFKNIKLNQKNELTTPVIDSNTKSNVENAYYGKDLINFKSRSAMKKMIDKAPLDDKIAFVYNKIDLGEFVVVGKSLAKASETITDIGERFVTPIERIHFLEHSLMEEVVILFLNPLGQKMIMNPHSLPIRLNGFEKIEPEAEKILDDTDRINLGNKWVEIKSKSDSEIDFEENIDLLLKTFDYTEQTLDIIRKNNKTIMRNFSVPQDKKTNSKFTFDKIGGQDEVIEILQERVLFPFLYPKAHLGIMPSTGAILAGIPGTGKSLIAKTLIAEAGVSGFEECATEMQGQYVGQSEHNCINLFKKAIDAQPSIIFLDEIDALGKNRGKDVHGDKLLNQFLYCMNEIEKNGDKVFVIGATNKPECLDEAFTRGGRFDLILECKAPDLKGTRQIIDIHTAQIPLDEKLNKDDLAQKMFSKKMTGADIAAVTRNAYFEALNRLGITKSMKERRFSPQMMDYFSVNEQDFDNAIAKYKTKSKERNPIGFNSIKK